MIGLTVIISKKGMFQAKKATSFRRAFMLVLKILLLQERNQHTGSNSRANYARNITRHAILQNMIR